MLGPEVGRDVGAGLGSRVVGGGVVGGGVVGGGVVGGVAVGGAVGTEVVGADDGGNELTTWNVSSIVRSTIRR